MADSAPELQRLLTATTPSDRDRAWQHFLDAYSRLLLHVARTVSRDHDEAMDAYTHVLQELRADNSARLRAFSNAGRSKFSTWLVVVVQRLCLDHRRREYGRLRDSQSGSTQVAQAFRRRLRNFVGDDIDLTSFAASAVDPDERLAAEELRHLLAVAIGALPPSDRLLLALRFEDGLSAQQIARVMHLPTPFHVYRRLDAAMRSLRSSLTARGVESAAP
jgi:RNA polymerase sigma factor (sigma-70 family)